MLNANRYYYAYPAMYVCLCKGVTDRDLAQAVSAGVCSMRELQRCTGAATQCGQCGPEVRACLTQALENTQHTHPSSGFMISPAAAPVIPSRNHTLRWTTSVFA